MTTRAGGKRANHCATNGSNPIVKIPTVTFPFLEGGSISLIVQTNQQSLGGVAIITRSPLPERTYLAPIVGWQPGYILKYFSPPHPPRRGFEDMPIEPTGSVLASELPRLPVPVYK